MSFRLKKFIFICLFAIPQIGFSQESNTLDSLQKVMLKTTKDSSRISLFICISKEIKREDSTKCFAYADSALILSLKLNDSLYTARAKKNMAEILRRYSKKLKAIPYFNEAAALYNALGIVSEVADINQQLGVVYFYLNDYTRALEYHQKSLALWKGIKDSAGIISGEQAVAAMHWRMGNLKPAQEHYTKALQVSEIINDSVAECAILNSLGAVNWGFGDYTKALEYYEKALKSAQKINYKEKYVLIINNIGLIYHEWENDEKAMENFLEGLSISKEEKYPYGLAYSYSNMGEIYQINNKFETALAYFDSALVNYKEISKQNGMAFCYRNIGNAYKGMKKYQLAIKFYQLSIKAAEEIDSKQHLSMALTALARVYFENKNYPLAGETVKRSLKISLKHEYKDISKDNYFLLSDLAEQNGLQHEALSYFKKASALKDSIFTEKSSRRLAEIQTKYEIEKKERENLVLRKEEQLKSIKLESNKKIIRIQYIVISAFAIFLMVVIVLAFLLNRNRRKLLKSKELLTGQNNEINKQAEELISQQEYLKKINTLLQANTTDLEAKKEELQEKVEELKKATAFKNKIFSIIGHDLRGPIGTISSIISLAMEDQLSEEKRQLMLSLTKESAVATYSLLENLLIWANSEQGEISYIPKNISIDEMVQGNINLLSEKAAEKSIILEKNIDPSVVVYADYNTLDTIIRNLLSNALKFTNECGRVNISASQKDHEVEIAVTDTGMGISDENLQKILDSDIHFTYKGTKGEKGSGLGLMLCLEFIKMNKGNYQINSEVGKGTRFTFTLPVAQN